MRLLLLALSILLLGCQSVAPTYQELTGRIAAGDTVPPRALREAFLAADDLHERMTRLGELERQALAIIEDEPLKLGSIGTAILDTYYGSLTGHYVLAQFYDHVASTAAAEPHRHWVTEIQAAMEDAGAGTRESPMPAMTPAEAHSYAASKGLTPVGSIYQTGYEADGEVPFLLLLQVRPEAGHLDSLSFDLQGMYQSLRENFDPGMTDATFSPFTVIGYLARQNDSAAQAAVGAFLATQDRLDDAVNWLRASSRSGNLLANSILARVFWEQARVAESQSEREQAMEEVLENYLHAVALGSADAMYALGVLYLNDHFGEENSVAGLPLLKQAAEQDHAESILFLAHLHYAGEGVERDLQRAREYYVRACVLENPSACRSFARLLLDRDAAQAADPRIVSWLETQSTRPDPEAMLLLGNLHARGIGTPASHRQALRWFKRAVDAAPEDPHIVNEVAWTLTVSDQLDLRRARYARDIMDHLMKSTDAARSRPEYLDTWAATYAATGDFARAIELQERALEVAAATNHDVVDILREHLEHFQSGRTLSETVP